MIHRYFKKQCWKVLATGLVALVSFCNIQTEAFSQIVSNEGSEFYAVFPTHVPSNDRLASYSIFITGKRASSGIISVGSFSQSFTVAANSVTEIEIPRSQAYIDARESNQVLTNRAIKIMVDPGKPKVVVYGHIFGAARSAASLILPKITLGQQYFSMNHYLSPNRDGGDNYIAIVGSEADTKVFIRKNNADLVPGGILLNQGDVYEFRSTDDLTGVEITTDPITSECKKIAVFSGSTNSLIARPGCIASSSDPLYQQNYPVDSWGANYGIIPLGDGIGNYIRVLASTDNTEITFEGEVVATLDAGEFYQPLRPVSTASVISANNPIAVAQFTLSQDCSGLGIGDPDMVILNPIEYNIKNITVYSSTRENITSQYINILIRTSAASTFRINDVAPVDNFQPVPGNEAYSYVQINLNRYSTSNFVLSASDGFNAIAYGFGDHESYAYSAGTNLASTQSITAVRRNTNEELPNACTREDFDFKLVLSSIASKIKWTFEDSPELEQENLNPNPVVRNGKTFYEYYYPGTYIFDSAGEKLIRVTVEYAAGNACNVTEETIDFTFDVFDPPKVAFESPDEGCVSAPIRFTDKSTRGLKNLSKWVWDFGDGQFSEEQHPTHVFEAPGIYSVKLITSDEVGCNGEVFTRDIIINPVVESTFSFSAPDCNDNTIVFSAAREPGPGIIEKWTWDFGDSSPTVEQSVNIPVSHTFPRVGMYEVTLTVSSNGCESTYMQVINVFSPSLEAGANAVILEGGEVMLDIEADGNNLQYKWVPSVGLSQDNIRNPIASPAEDITYTVTITSEEGCVLSDTIRVAVVKNILVPNTFTPNGDGFNDLWEIENLNTNPAVEVKVFNRYGEVLVNSVGYKMPWDGRYRGENLPVGTYYYIINHKNLGKIMSGSVTILR